MCFQHAGSFQLRLLLMGVRFVLCLTGDLPLLAPLAAVVTMASSWRDIPLVSSRSRYFSVWNNFHQTRASWCEVDVLRDLSVSFQRAGSLFLIANSLALFRSSFSAWHIVLQGEFSAPSALSLVTTSAGPCFCPLLWADTSPPASGQESITGLLSEE